MHEDQTPLLFPSSRLGGESPLGNLDGQQLEVFALRALVAMFDAVSCLSMAQAADPQSLYWGTDGSGGHALAEANAVIQSLGLHSLEAYDHATYRSYFRGARPLLFPGVGRYRARLYCPACLTWVEQMSPDPARAMHGDPACTGAWRRMTLQDIHDRVKE
jgi:hypothetical protein